MEAVMGVNDKTVPAGLDRLDNNTRTVTLVAIIFKQTWNPE
jgi:hypothetical protein